MSDIPGWGPSGPAGGSGNEPADQAQGHWRHPRFEAEGNVESTFPMDGSAPGVPASATPEYSDFGYSEPMGFDSANSNDFDPADPFAALEEMDAAGFHPDDYPEPNDRGPDHPEPNYREHPSHPRSGDALAALNRAAREFTQQERQNQIQNSDPELDAIAATHARLQAMLAQHGIKPKTEANPQPVKRREPKKLGRPTGKDGRPLRRRREPARLGALLEEEIERRGWRQNLAGGSISANWASLVGEKIAEHTKVLMVKDSTVFVQCDSTAWATQLRLSQKVIIAAIAEKVGHGIVEKLHIYGPQGPSWRKGKLHVKGRGPRDTYG